MGYEFFISLDFRQTSSIEVEPQYIDKITASDKLNNRTLTTSQGDEKMRSLLTALAVLLASLLAPLGAQVVPLLSRKALEKPRTTLFHAGLNQTRLILKLRDNSLARAINGSLRNSPNGLDVRPVTKVLEATAGTHVVKLFSLREHRLQAMRFQGERSLKQGLADLRSFFDLRVPNGVDIKKLCDRLNALKEVELAYPAPLPVVPPGDIPPPTPLYLGFQGYRGPAPNGIAAAWTYSNNYRGKDVTITDIEYSWEGLSCTSKKITHEDLMQKGLTALLGAGPSAGLPRAFIDHGTASVGLLVADADQYGMHGISPDSDLRVVPVHPCGGKFNVADAIIRATRALKAGDVLLIEQQTGGPNFNKTQFGMVPVEYNAAEFCAIRQATAIGIHVVEAAGNGSQDFDSVRPPKGHPTYKSRFNVAVRDSGAILVAASSSSTPHLALSFTNRGKRIDSYAWGENVATLGYGDLKPFGVGNDSRQFYTRLFSGTSSASAIIAGAVSVIQAEHTKQNKTTYSPWALRAMLRTSGTVAGRSQPIGRMPDLKQATSLVSNQNIAYRFPKKASAVCGPGDLNGDGYPELVIGEPPVVYIYSGADGSLLYSLGNVSSFGSTLAAAGDVNGDKIGDFVVGAPSGLGFAYLYSGALPSKLLFSWSGKSIGGRFGSSISANADINGDGKNDIVIGEPDTNNSAGRAYVFSGATGKPLFPSITFAGKSSGDRYGTSVAIIGDIRPKARDGKAEFLIGAPYNDTAAPNAGIAYLYDGATGKLILPLTGSKTNQGFGSKLSDWDDLNKDKVSDFVVSDDFARLNVFSGMSLTRLRQISTNRIYQITPAGDIDGDGLKEIFVAHGNCCGRYSRWKITVISGKGNVLKTVNGVLGNALGNYPDVAACGDINRDGVEDIFAWLPSYNGDLCALFLSGDQLAPLTASANSLSVAKGGSVFLTFRPGLAPPQTGYLILAGLSGSYPGIQLPGDCRLLLNIDWLTLAGLAYVNQPPFSTFFGPLPKNGIAKATFGPFQPLFLKPVLGKAFTFAAITLLPPPGFIGIASNPVLVGIVP